MMSGVDATETGPWRSASAVLAFSPSMPSTNGAASLAKAAPARVGCMGTLIAIEQHHPQLFFQLLNVGADRGLADLKLVGGLGHAAYLDCYTKALQLAQLHVCVSNITFTDILYYLLSLVTM